MAESIHKEVYDARNSLQKTGQAGFIVSNHNNDTIGKEVQQLPDRFPGTRFQVTIQALPTANDEACDDKGLSFEEHWRSAMSPDHPMSPKRQTASPRPFAPRVEETAKSSKSIRPNCSSTVQKPPDAPRAMRFSDRNRRRKTQRERRRSRRCGNCKQNGHTVAECVHPSEDGFVHGCPVCNSGTHSKKDFCQLSLQWPSLYSALKMAITRRGNRPPLAAFAGWADLLLEADHSDKYRLPGIFPWTPTFCRSKFIGQPGPFFWENFKYFQDHGNGIAADPITRNLAAVKANHSRIVEDNGRVSRATMLPWPSESAR